MNVFKIRSSGNAKLHGTKKPGKNKKLTYTRVDVAARQVDLKIFIS